MPRDSQGNFSNVFNWEQDAANGIGIEADRHQQGDDDQAQGLTDSLDRKGRGGMQADLAMGNFVITQVNEGSAATDAANLGQIQGGAYAYDATETGVANAYVIQLSPAPTSYSDGLRASFIPANTNTGASTLQIGGLTPAPAIQWQGSPLTGGEIVANGICEVEYSGGAFQILNVPATLPVDKGGTGASDAATARTNLGLGTASVEDVGTAIGDVVQLEDVSGSAGLPAVDGSQLTGVSATPGLKQQVFTVSGTFNKTSIGNATSIIVEARGGGGAGGGTAATGASQIATGGGGGQGERVRSEIAAASLGATETVTIGAGGTGVSGAAGNNGGTTSLGTLVTANGGNGGSLGTVQSETNGVFNPGGAGGTGGTADISFGGAQGHSSAQFSNAISGAGGGEGGGNAAVNNGSPTAGVRGAGGGGASSLASQAAKAGAAGGDGYLIVTWVET